MACDVRAILNAHPVSVKSVKKPTGIINSWKLTTLLALALSVQDVLRRHTNSPFPAQSGDILNSLCSCFKVKMERGLVL